MKSRRRENFFLEKIHENILSIDENGHIYREFDEFRCQSMHKRIDFQSRGGYFRVIYRQNRMIYECEVHRLIYAYFAEIPDDMQVHHIDGNKANNHWSNLQAVTPKQNIHHSIYVLGARLGTRNPNTKFTPPDIEKVFELRHKGLLLREIAKIMNVSICTVGKILQGKTWKIRQ